MFSQVASSAETKPSSSTHRSRALTWGIAFAALYIIALMASEVASLGKPIQISLALLPVPAFALFLVEWIRGNRQLDELERRLQLEALAIAYPLALVFIMALGLIQRVTPLSPADWSYRHIWPFLIAFYFLGLAIARRRYR